MFCVLGLEKVPNLQTWIGGAIILSGIGAVAIGEYQRDSVKESSAAGDIDEKNTKNANDSKQSDIEMVVGHDSSTIERVGDS